MDESSFKIIGITGGSGSGKSLVACRLANFGTKTVDADEVAREVTAKGHECLAEIIENFGTQYLNESGELDRRQLGKMVFENPDRLPLLNQITHKYIIRRIEEIIREMEKREDDSPAVVVDAPLLFESGMEGGCDVVIAVLAEEELRIKRIADRDGISEEAAVKRIMAQPDDSFYSKRADFIIYNNGNEQELFMQVDMIAGLLFG